MKFQKVSVQLLTILNYLSKLSWQCGNLANRRSANFLYNKFAICLIIGRPTIKDKTRQNFKLLQIKINASTPT